MDISGQFLILKCISGFNDVMTQLHYCLQYAIQSNRILIVDLKYYGYYRVSIYDYILFTHPNIYNGDIDQFYKSDLYLSQKQNIKRISICDLKTYVTYDTIGLYFHNILGEPNITFKLFQYITFTDIIKNTYRMRIGKMPINYIAVHIRNTDRSCDVTTFIEEKDNIFKDNSVFVATDNRHTLDFLIEKYRDNIYTFTQLDYVEKGGLHNGVKNRTGIQSVEYFIDTIVDLLLLASAKELHVSTPWSGYSNLALHLFNNIGLLNI